ncbi:hypothetical protein HPB47_016008 [Ixodes persulcatus]|uniref:Uncharacterized protein n=1 Tax=Ixodes persulcatus TaxID=34615 RepID=A0AC60QRZ1_IXOPE|nr:hypothetical protein HPB47_016008 [Ixodes persulcatus]
MCALPGQLERIEGLQFSLYADDITLWVNQGSDSEIEQRLQAATDTIVRYAAERGLACSPQKSELFVYNPKHLRCKAPSDILIQVARAEVPKVEQIRILGLVLQSHGHNGETRKRLESHVMQTLSLIRRNMHPEHNKIRREKRAEAISLRYRELPSEQVAYVDAACGNDGRAVAAILDQRQIARTITLIWTPAHASVPGNEAAHELARGLYHRAGEDPLWQGSDPSLNNTQAVAWRRLQTYTYPHPILVNHMFPDIRSDECTHCGLGGSLDHIIWECSNSPGRALNIASKESWETLLRSSDPELQLRLVRLAEEAAGTQDLLASI